MQKPITATYDIQAAASGDKKKRRFKITAYTGGPMSVGNWDYPVILDVAGIEIPHANMPIYIDHNESSDYLIGQTAKIEAKNGTLTAEGDITATSNPRVNGLIEMADNGFNWQASVTAHPKRIQFIGEGETVDINGSTFEGPVYAVWGSILQEISFVALGADLSTQAVIANRNSNNGAINMNDAKSIEQIRAESVAETKRVEAIRKHTKNHPDIEAQAIEGGWTPEKTELEVLRAERNQTPFLPPKSENIDPANSRKILACKGLMMAGKRDVAGRLFSDEINERAKKIEARSWADLERQALQLAGVNASGVEDVIQASQFSTYDPIVQNVMDYIIQDQAISVEQNWRSFCRVRDLRNFKSTNVFAPNMAAELEELGRGGEIKHVNWANAEDFENICLQTFAKQAVITRQDYANDELGVIVEAFEHFVRAAFRSLNTAVWSKIMANTVGSEGATFFNATNGNYLAGAETSLTGADPAAALAAGIIAIRKQRDAGGNDLDIIEKVLAVPTELMMDAKALLNSVELARKVATNDRLPTGNPAKDLNIELVTESRLSNSGITGNSAKAWYLFAGPQHAPVNVAFLNGIEKPVITQFTPSDMPDIDGYSWKCTFDYGISFGDPKAAFKGLGEAG